MIGPFLVLSIAEGRRERGARMELVLRVDVVRLCGGGDVERGEGERRGPDTSSEVVVAAVAIPGISEMEDVGESVWGEVTSPLLRCSRATSINRSTCSTASPRFFAEEKWILRLRRPCTSITSV